MSISTRVMALAILASTVATPALADVKAGVDAWSRGDYARAIKEWRQPAIDGDADAQFNMAQAYKLGRGVPVDLLIAEDWYRKAALQGHIQAEDNYGLVMFQNGNRQKAMPFIEKSAGRGEPRAQYVLGTALFNGDMVKKDWPRAYALMTRASAAGLAPASASLAQMDKFIPLDQRQKGLALARDMELASQRTMLPSSGTVTGTAPVLSRPVARPSAPIKTAELPPSRPAGVDFETPEAPEAPVARPTPRPAPPKQVAVVTPKPVPLPKPAPAPAVKPAAPKPAQPAIAATPGGRWRVQLGAFGEEGRARAMWNSLEGRIGALDGMQPFLVKAGSVTRLQAGPLGSKAAAEQLCARVRASGNACLPVGG